MAVALVFLLLAGSPGSPPRLPARVGECRLVHGRALMANGTPSVRILVLHTRRILGVEQQDLTYRELPASIRRLWGADGEASSRYDIVGDFTVCARTPSRPGWMQMVRVVAARRLIAVER